MTNASGVDAVVALKGGLGNQLFQWAFGRGLAAAGATVAYDAGLLRAPVQLEIAPLLDGSRVVSGPTRTLRTVRRLHLPTSLAGRRFVAERGFAYDLALVGSLRGRVLLEGYWQSPRWFASEEQAVRTAVQGWAGATLSAEGRVLAERIASDAASCSVHVRRGDYVTNATAGATHGVLDAAYYRSAVSRARERGAGHCFVFTNDPAWAGTELGLDDAEVVPWSVASSPVGEVGLMARCAHHVVANSSFSWWGAWLDEGAGTTVAPARWFARDDMDTSDLVPAHWERVDN